MPLSCTMREKAATDLSFPEQMETVLIVEDDATMLRGLEDNFKLKGYHVRTATDGEKGLNTALAERPDLIILDIMLPKINGYEVCSLIRERNLHVPIIMLTAKTEESDQILGLDIGADDYITKPFSIKVLLARAQALLRRRQVQKPPMYEFGNCQLNVTNGTFKRSGKEIKLSPGEFRLLCLFLERAGNTLTREEILHSVWGYSHFFSLRDVDLFVNNLRKKIEQDPNNATFLRDVGRGNYRFELS
jgi:two-component system alkaline phosphatase synthesis response regulator PhoP